jgi:lipopolysaccharide assembly outer membrane protein LptD (OstA)
MVFPLPNLSPRKAAGVVLLVVGLVAFGWGTVAMAQTRASKAGSILKPQGEQEVEVDGSKGDLSFDTQSGDILAEGKTGQIIVSCGNIRLFADKVRFNKQTKQSRAEGHVRLIQGGMEWFADAVDYNFETGAINTGHTRAQLDDNVFFEGESATSSDKRQFVLKNSYLTTCDYDQPNWRLKAGTIVVHPRERVSLRNLVLYAGSVPIFYFPYLVLPLDDYDISSGTQVQVGQKSKWGFFVLNSYTTRVADGVRPTYRLDYRANRGVAGGVDLRYKASVEEEDGSTPPDQQYPRVSGKIKTYYSDDDKIRKGGNVEVVTSTGSYNQNVSPQRYQVRVTQRAELREDVYSKLKANKLSDPNFLEDYFEKEFQRDPQPDNFLEITKWSPNATLSAMARPKFNNFFTTTERLPEVRYDLKRQPIFGGPLFYEGENSAAYLNKDFANGSSSSNYHATRLDSFHQILYPKQYFGWLNFVPRVGGRGTFYDTSPAGANNPSQARGVLNAGFELSYKATRTWRGVQDKKWEIDGLRHIMEPSLNYGFVARPTKGPGALYQFDVARSSFGIDKNLVPIDFPQYTGVDSIDKRNVFRPAVRQRLQTRRDGAPWDLAELLVYQDILVERNVGEKTFSDTFAEFRANPVRWFSLGWLGRYDPNENQLRETTGDLTFFHGKDWKVSLSHSYFRDVGNQVGVNFAWSLNENWTVRTSHRVDPSDGSLMEQSYALDRDFQAWIVSLVFSQLRPLNHDSDLRVWLAFTLKAFPEVSVDSNSVGSQTGMAY